MQTYIALKPHEDGHPRGGGYECGACGLEGLLFGEPHISSAGRVCEPPVPMGVAVTHPQAAFAGKGVLARAMPLTGSGHLLERLDGTWQFDDLAPRFTPSQITGAHQDTLSAIGAEVAKLPQGTAEEMLERLRERNADTLEEAKRPEAPIEEPAADEKFFNADGTPIATEPVPLSMDPPPEIATPAPDRAPASEETFAPASNV